jgi:hypothetical protein
MEKQTMKDTTKFSEQELKAVLKFTIALADNEQNHAGVNFADMQTDEASLLEAEKQAIDFARKRNAGLAGRSTLGEIATDEDGNVAERIRDWMRRTNRVKN